MPRRPGFAGRVIEVGRGHRVFFQMRFRSQQSRHARADRKALRGQGDGRLEQAGPRQLAVLCVGLCQHGYCTGHAHRAAAHYCVRELQRLTLVVQKQGGRCGRGGGLTAIEGLGGFAVEVQQERTAPDATALWLHQRQHHLHGNGRIHRAAACGQHLAARVGGQRVGGGNRIVARGPARLGAAAGSRFRLSRRGDVVQRDRCRTGCTGGKQRGRYQRGKRAESLVASGHRASGGARQVIWPWVRDPAGKTPGWAACRSRWPCGWTGRRRR